MKTEVEKTVESKDLISENVRHQTFLPIKTLKKFVLLAQTLQPIIYLHVNKIIDI